MIFISLPILPLFGKFDTLTMNTFYRDLPCIHFSQLCEKPYHLLSMGVNDA